MINRIDSFESPTSPRGGPLPPPPHQWQYALEAGNPAYFAFIVTTHTEDPFLHWTSAPIAAARSTISFQVRPKFTFMPVEVPNGSVSTIWLTWNEVTTGVDGSPEPGPIRYRIYYDNYPDFVPGPGNLSITTYDLSYSHTDIRIGDPAANLFHLVTAIDGSDNESAESNRVGEFDSAIFDVE